MAQLALPLTDTDHGVTHPAHCAEIVQFPAPARKALSPLALEIAILGLLLTSLQIADGVMTAVGVAHYGTAIEGNFFLRSLMESYGVITTLVGVKILAVAIILGLCQLAFSVTWLRSALKAIISLYLFAAILPWGYILFGSLN